MVCFIHRPEYYRITEDEQGNSLLGIAEIIVAKHRAGPTADIRLRFRQELARFQDVEEDMFGADEDAFGQMPAHQTFSSKMNAGDPAALPANGGGGQLPDFPDAAPGFSKDMPF